VTCTAALPNETQPQPDTQRMFASLGSRNFRKYVVGQTVSNVGTWTQRIAQDWLVLTLTGSAAAVGITTALQFVPTVLFGMVGGLAADRFDKRRILLGTQSALGLCAAALAILCLSGRVQIWHIFVIAFAGGTAAAIDNPTRQAFVHEMVGPAHLRNAVSINSAIFQLGALVGPAVSAVLISLFGIGWSFAVNSSTSVVVLIALAKIRSSTLIRAPALARGSGQLRAAVAEIIRRPELIWPIVLAGVCGFFTANFAVTLTAYAQGFAMSAAGYGLLTSSLAVGSLTGALLAARQQHARLRTLVELAFALALAQLVASITPGPLTLCLALIGIGAACVPFGITANATVQLAAGDAIRGRVMGAYLLVVMGAAAAGGPVIGAVDELFGPRTGLITGGLVTIAAAAAIGWQLSKATNTPVPLLLRSGVSRMRRQLGVLVTVLSTAAIRDRKDD